MDGSRPLKRPSDGEPSEGAKRQRVEGQTSGGFGSGPAGRHHRRITDTTRKTYDQAGTSDHRRSLDQASPSRPLTEPEQPKQRQATLAQQLAMLARLDKIAEQGQTNSSDQVQKDARSNKRQEINFAPPASPLHEQQQQSKENDRDLLEAHGPRRDAPIQSSTHHSSDTPFQKHPLDNLNQKGQIEQQQEIAVQQHEMHDQAGPSRQGDTANHSDHLELSISDFELCSMELHKPHDQTQVPSSQSLPEIRQPLDEKEIKDHLKKFVLDSAEEKKTIYNDTVKEMLSSIEGIDITRKGLKKLEEYALELLDTWARDSTLKSKLRSLSNKFKTFHDDYDYYMKKQ